MSQVQKRADELEEEFCALDTWEDRYSFIIELGREMPPLPPDEKNEETKLHGCQSQVWMSAVTEPGKSECKMLFRAESDSQIVSGLAALLLELSNGCSPAEISDFNFEAWLAKLALSSHLSANRRGGLLEMIKRIQNLARASMA